MTLRLAALVLAAVLLLAAPNRALAHGGVVGPQDAVQDYGVLLFLLAVVVIGAGVVAWVLRSPDPVEEDD